MFQVTKISLNSFKFRMLLFCLMRWAYMLLLVKAGLYPQKHTTLLPTTERDCSTLYTLPSTPHRYTPLSIKSALRFCMQKASPFGPISSATIDFCLKMFTCLSLLNLRFGMAILACGKILLSLWYWRKNTGREL